MPGVWTLWEDQIQLPRSISVKSQVGKRDLSPLPHFMIHSNRLQSGSGDKSLFPTCDSLMFGARFQFRPAKRRNENGQTPDPPTEGGTAHPGCYKHGLPTEGGTGHPACYKHDLLTEGCRLRSISLSSRGRREGRARRPDHTLKNDLDCFTGSFGALLLR